MQRSLIGFSKNCSLPQRHPVTEKVITCVRWRLLCPEKIIDTYAAATQHVDQGLSLTLFFRDTATTRDINR
ncbi:hypothetical protein ISX56_30575, partial [Serratia ureilytica]|nr:hypothetical protein [Serratia ureilytica]